MMPSPKDIIYPDGNDCSKCIHCDAVKLGKVQCNHFREEIEPDLSGPHIAWPVPEECQHYEPRGDFQ